MVERIPWCFLTLKASFPLLFESQTFSDDREVYLTKAQKRAMLAVGSSVLAESWVEGLPEAPATGLGIPLGFRTSCAVRCWSGFGTGRDRLGPKLRTSGNPRC